VVWISTAHWTAFHDAGEFCKDAITGGIDEASAMLLDQRID